MTRRIHGPLCRFRRRTAGAQSPAFSKGRQGPVGEIPAESVRAQALQIPVDDSTASTVDSKREPRLHRRRRPISGLAWRGVKPSTGSSRTSRLAYPREISPGTPSAFRRQPYGSGVLSADQPFMIG